jgi:ABC-type molybdenum transport system ATPase subunit/photorepair protein PhrA
MIETLKSRVNVLAYEINANKKVLDRTRKEFSDLGKQIHVLNLASEVLKNIGDQKKKKTIGVFERVVTSAINEFGFNYRFVIDIDSGGKRVQTKFKLVNEFGQEMSLLGHVGGGLLDIVSVVLRVLILVSVRPRRSRIIYLDENFKFLSVQHRDKAANLLKSLSKNLQLQWVFVTHQPEFIETEGANVYELYKVDGGASARRIK